MTSSASRKKNIAKTGPDSHDDPEQSVLFIEAAKAHGADTGESPADAMLRQMASKPPKPHKE